MKIIRKIIQEIPVQDWDDITSVNNQLETGHLAVAIFQHFLHFFNGKDQMKCNESKAYGEA